MQGSPQLVFRDGLLAGNLKIIEAERQAIVG